jgi:hypothetical protein
VCRLIGRFLFDLWFGGGFFTRSKRRAKGPILRKIDKSSGECRMGGHFLKR